MLGWKISGWRLSGFGLDSKASFTDLTDSSNSSRAVELEAKDHHDARVMQTCCLHFDTMDDGIRANCLGLFPPVFSGFIHIAWESCHPQISKRQKTTHDASLVMWPGSLEAVVLRVMNFLPEG